MREPKILTSLRLTASLMRRLREYAEGQDLSVAAVIRLAVKDYLDAREA